MRTKTICILTLGCLSGCMGRDNRECAALDANPSLSSAASFSETRFDYLIIGGGTAGLAVATRLAENSNVKVGVIEAGFFRQGDPLVDVPAFEGQAIGNPNYDWAFVTTPQPLANGRSVATPRGKMLGGSSGLNLIAWDRASKPEYDAWQAFGAGTGWTWDSLLPYFKKSETVATKPSNPFPGISTQAAQAAQAERSRFEGSSGPVQVSFNGVYPDVVPPFVKTLNSMGIATNAFPGGGNTTGVYNSYAAVDRVNGVRSYAATAYYCPSSFRKNLHVLVGAQATKILFKDEHDAAGALTATGVTFAVNNQTFSVNASREVVISAGAAQTPQLLELSGIGNTTLLKGLGIKPLIDLPGVGENLQEHLFVANEFTLNPGHHTFDELRNNATFAEEQSAQYNSTHDGLLASTDSPVAFLPLKYFVNASRIESMIEILDHSIAMEKLSPLQKLQYDMQRNWLKEGTVPQAEIIESCRGSINPAVNTSYITLVAGFQHPFSRGSVHINTTDPLAAPVIDPRYLSNDFDTQMLLETAKFSRRISQTLPLAKDVQTPFIPPPSVKSDDDFISFVRGTAVPGDHIIGTAALASKELGGVVDSELKVYGTANLRVADASVMPLHIGAHLQATVFAIGEKAADMIKDHHEHSHI